MSKVFKRLFRHRRLFTLAIPFLATAMTFAIVFPDMTRGLTSRLTPKSPHENNVDYFKHTLGPIVLNNLDSNGEVYEHFEQAHSASGKTLSHRGDYYGNSYAYNKLGSNSFIFYSYGSDNEFGTKDDTAVIYDGTNWITHQGDHSHLLFLSY